MKSIILRRMANLRRSLPAEYILPIALLFTLSFGCLFGLLFHLTNVQDEMQRQSEVRLVEQVTSSAVKLSDHDLRDYAVWDEAVYRLVHRFDEEWARDNLGPYLGGEQGYDHVFVLTGDNRLAYIHHQGAVAPGFSLERSLGPAFASALQKVRAVPNDGDPLVAGYSRSGNELYIFSVSAIVPLTSKAVLPPGGKSVIGIAKKLRPGFFRGALDVQLNPKLDLRRTIADAGSHSPLRSPSGEVLAHVTWSPRSPGSMLRHRIFPAFLLIGLVCFIASGFIVRRGRLALEAVRFSEKRAQHLAQHDLLTGIPNRRAMQIELEAQLSRGEPVSLLYMDLDGFKETNDVYGHGAGDGLLKAVAVRLRDQVPMPYMVARVGGDEFALVMAAGEDEAIEVARTVLAAFSTAFSVGEYRVSLGISIGLATGRSPLDADELARRADSAMYAAKEQGKQCLQCYNPAVDAGRERRMQLEADLRAAIEEGAIGIVYQGIVCARSRQIVGVEALARWHHPVLGQIPPDQFIPIAESSGLIVELGQGILMAACRDARDWPVDLAVNLSPAQFWDRGLAQTIAEVLEATAFPPERLELEITEGYLMRRPQAAAQILRQLKALGVRVSLDDFGTGFASIGYLQQLSFDGIKIDRSFVAASIMEPKAADLSKAIVAIGKALDVPITAEGVECQRLASLMQKAGCARLQGWLFGRPMPSAEMERWFEEAGRLAG